MASGGVLVWVGWGCGVPCFLEGAFGRVFMAHVPSLIDSSTLQRTASCLATSRACVTDRFRRKSKMRWVLAPLIPSGLLPGHLIPGQVAPLGWDLSMALGLGFGGRASQGPRGHPDTWEGLFTARTGTSSHVLLLHSLPKAGPWRLFTACAFLDARHLPRTPAMPPQGFGASHFSWVAFFPRPRSPLGALVWKGLTWA